MNRFLVFAVLAIAAFATAAWGDNDSARSFTIAPEISRSPQQVDGGGIAFEVKNIQVEAEWSVMDGGAGLTIDDNGVLTWPSDLSASTVVVTVIVEDNFSKLNDDYVNLAASAIITINFVNPRIYMIAGYINSDIWSSANGKDWEKCDVAYDSHQSFAAAVFKGKIYTFGGRNNGNSTRSNRVRSTDDCDQPWGPDVLANGHAYWDKRDGLAVAVLNDTLFLTGGYAGSTRYRDDVWSSTDGAVWTKENSTGLGSRYYHRMLSYNGTLYISGGNSSYNSTRQDVLSSENGVDWTQIANQASLKRQNHGFVVHKGKFYIIGGAEKLNNGNDSFKNDVWSSVDGATWTIEQNATIGTARGGIRAVSMNGKIYIMGGRYNNVNFNSSSNVWSSSNGTNWTIEPGTPGWSSRFNYGAVIYN